MKALIIAVVNHCSRNPWKVVATALLLTVLSSAFVGNNFAINTDISKLISDDLPWRQRENAFYDAFPQQDSIVAVLDAPTPELAANAAARLIEKLQLKPKAIIGADNLNNSPFFKKNGLLFLSDAELTSTLDRLSQAKQILRPLAEDQNLKGIMDAVGISLFGVRFHRITLHALNDEFNRLSSTIDDILQGKPSYFSWRELLSGGDTTEGNLRRQIIQIYPVLDYEALEPGADATETIRKLVTDLKLEDDGVKVRLTGGVRISDEEFSTLQDGAALNGAITIALVLLILWFALHSLKIILAVFLSLIVGLSMTAALGLVLVGAFNPISIAFFVLFVGIGVDFGLQFSVSYRAERFEGGNVYEALVATARSTGSRLALAALATAAGFLSFMPTDYRGLSELGEIAGLGMMIAFITSITVLPALLNLFNPPAEADPLGYASLEPVDRYLDRHRKAVLIGTLAVVTLGAPLLFWLRFDTNPMNLRSPYVESVSTYNDLRKDPMTRGNTAELLVPTLIEAYTMSTKLSTLPQVDKVVSLSSFVPEDQDKKLVAIKGTAAEILPILNPEAMQPTPSDQDIVTAIQATAKGLRDVADKDKTDASLSARRLSDVLTRLSQSEQSYRKKVQTALVTPLKITFDDIKTSLNPEPVSIDHLPQNLYNDWKTKNGQFRLSIYPKANTDDNVSLREFVDAISSVAPNVTGAPVGILHSGEDILKAFKQAAFWALLSIAVLLWITLKRFTDVLLTLVPLLLAGLVTLELCVVINLPLNFANIIALPVLLGVGVAFKIYYVMAWREGKSNLLASPLTRAVFYSGATTAVAFGSLWFSNHPGTSSMGELLALSLVSTMAAAVLFQPLLMGPPRLDGETISEPELSHKPAEAFRQPYPKEEAVLSNPHHHKISPQPHNPR